ncbi:iron(III) transport system permease protein [Nocardioides sp. J9]|uniref:ABC transporter permease n=1 Tax=unclassified Nocardioides TaxID=2615069 RepID=UPI0004AFC40A|nr:MULTISPECIES: iron ABC transporter permease [unclassified Nocardioides]TWG99153.1 iron(III) transport system permease protein [Nocardioides sp. J9]
MAAPALPLLLVGLAVAALALVPLGYVLWSTAELGPGEAGAFLWRPRIGELLWNTTRLLVVGVLASVAVGVAGAWVVERTDVPGRGWWHGLLCAPLAVPAFVNGFGWVSTTHAVQSFPGAVMVVTLSYYPLVYLPTVAALRRLDPAVEEVATALGRSPWSVFWRVTLPATSPAVLGGALLVGLHLLAEYGALQLLNYPTLTTAILQQYGTVFNGPEATLLALVLVAFCLLLLGLELLLRGRRPRSRVGAGTSRVAGRVPLGRARPLVVLALAGLVLWALAVPLAALVRWLVRGTSAGIEGAELADALGNTLLLAVLGGLVTTAAAVPVVWLAVRHRSLLTTAIERSVYTASAMPGIVIALALVTVSIRAVPDLYQTMALLVAGYLVLFLPRAVVSVRGTFELVPPALEEVARSLGCSGPEVARRVTLPLVVPGLAGAGALVALAVSTELTATLLLAPIGTDTLATKFWSEASSIAYGAAAPYALALIVLSVPSTWLLARLSTRSDR